MIISSKRFIQQWVFPPAIWELLRSLKSGRTKSEFPNSFQAIKNSKSGRCFILASGPSILKQDLKLLAGETVIACSHAHKHPDIGIIKPAYHVLAPFHEPFTFSDCAKYFNDFDAYYRGVDIFLGHRPYKYSFENYLKAHPGHRKHNNFYKIDYSGSQQLDEKNYRDPSLWDIGITPYDIRTVVYIAVQLAYHLGFKEIFLLGCDHDYLYAQNREGGNRFYQDKEGINDNVHLSSFDSEKWYKEYYMRWMQYRLMKQFLDAKGVKVYNATEGGYLDVFPRVKYEAQFTSKQE